jgi:glycerophosphoryl diester phosphodiesterase
VLQALVAVLVTALVPGAVGPSVQAHRGGPLVDGRPAYAESTLPAFRAAAARDEPVELDLHATADGVLVVLHDATLDRTTTCTGPVAAITAQALRASCPTDRLGSPGSAAGSRATFARVPVPTLAEVLTLMRRTGLRATLEIKDSGDAARRTAAALATAIDRSGVALGQVQVHAFHPEAIAAARHDIPGVSTSSITLGRDRSLAIDRARTLHADAISPQWPVSAAFVRRAHAAGLRVVPWTLDDAGAVRAAGRAGVDTVMTDDPVMASRVLARQVIARLSG